MLHPFKSIDRWASQSVDRTALLMWLLAIAFGLFVALAVIGEVWYTEPAPTHRVDQVNRAGAPA